MEKKRPYKTIFDIEKENEERERKEFTSKVSKDIRNIFDGVFEPSRKPIRKKKKNWFLGIIKWLGILFFGLLLINFILGNLWLLKFFIKDFFGG